jgi:hypothetical protein
MRRDGKMKAGKEDIRIKKKYERREQRRKMRR